MASSSSGATVVVDLGFGDAGKGSLVDWLVRERAARLVVRFNGGAQAGHNVVLDDGRHHTFSQLGSGTFVPGVSTHLSEDVVIHPTALLVEARVLAAKGVVDPLQRLSIARSARVITPFHQAANRLREMGRGEARHGTCGVGVGEAVRDALANPDDAVRARDVVGDRGALKAQLLRVRERVAASLDTILLSTESEVFEDRAIIDRWVDAVAPLREQRLVVPDEALGDLWKDRTIVLEGAQGVLLDERLGFHPHTTWSDCTFMSATRLLERHEWTGSVERIGVMRAYVTRHGHGPLPTEDQKLGGRLPELHNESAGWQGAFRRGWPDLVLLRYARAVCGGVDGLAITHLDCLPALSPCKVARAYGGIEEAGLVEHDEATLAIRLRPGDLAHQERLAVALRRARPDYCEMPSAPAAFVERIEGELGMRVRVTSHGPKAKDKRERA